MQQAFSFIALSVLSSVLFVAVSDDTSGSSKLEVFSSLERIADVPQIKEQNILDLSEVNYSKLPLSPSSNIFSLSPEAFSTDNSPQTQLVSCPSPHQGFFDSDGEIEQPIQRENSAEIYDGYTVRQFSQFLRLKTNDELLHARIGAELGERRELLPSPLGSVALRWPSEVETNFTSHPRHVVSRVWSAAEQVLRNYEFPSSLVEARYDWNVVLRRGAPVGAKGRLLNSSFRHTAWMGPPADIVVDAEGLVLTSDGGADGASKALARSLIHEIGHAVEFQLLGRGFSRRQRWHSEGFASWFEGAGVQKLNGGDALREMKLRAKGAFRKNWRPYLFNGAPEDYLQSFALLAVIIETQSLQHLVAVYKRMDSESCTFSEAVLRELGWSEKEWFSRTQAYLNAD